MHVGHGGMLRMHRGFVQRGLEEELKRMTDGRESSPPSRYAEGLHEVRERGAVLSCGYD